MTICGGPEVDTPRQSLVSCETRGYRSRLRYAPCMRSRPRLHRRMVRPRSSWVFHVCKYFNHLHDARRRVPSSLPVSTCRPSGVIAMASGVLKREARGGGGPRPVKFSVRRTSNLPAWGNWSAAGNREFPRAATCEVARSDFKFIRSDDFAVASPFRCARRPPGHIRRLAPAGS
jgi:hypothetical protein